MKFNEKIVVLRKIKKITQDELACAVGVSRQAVYKWECGQSYPEVPKLLEMKLLLSISIDELLDDSYDIPLPEKKKRKRISKEAKQEIEANIVKEEKPIPAPKAAPAPAAKPAAPKAAPAPKAEAPKAAPAPAPAAAPEVKEEVKVAAPVAVPAPKVEEAPAAAPAPEAEASDNKNDKKGGFFSKLFGGKK